MDEVVSAECRRLLRAVQVTVGTLPSLPERPFESVLRDLDACVSRDPAYGQDRELIVATHGGFRALMHHRLAHALYTTGTANGLHAAHYLQHQASSLHGVDIHPGARIGDGAILDHPYGIVIGETAEVGPRCYILGGCILGARGINGNPPHRRHPRIGCDSELGARACLLGPITVGDRVFIGPNAVVQESVPDDARVTVVTRLQQTRLPGRGAGDGAVTA